MESHQQTPLTTQTPAISMPRKSTRVCASIFFLFLIYYAFLSLSFSLYLSLLPLLVFGAADAVGAGAEMLHHTAIWLRCSFVPRRFPSCCCCCLLLCARIQFFIPVETGQSYVNIFYRIVTVINSLESLFFPFYFFGSV